MYIWHTPSKNEKSLHFVANTSKAGYLSLFCCIYSSQSIRAHESLFLFKDPWISLDCRASCQWLCCSCPYLGKMKSARSCAMALCEIIYSELILQYENLLHILPDPCVASSKRSWERQMYHVPAVARHVQDCHETGDPSSLFAQLLHVQLQEILCRQS